MEIPVSDAKAKLTEHVRRAEAGEEIVLTRNGKIVARIEAARPAVDKARRAARTFSTMKTAFPSDRRRYFGVDGVSSGRG